MGRIPDDVIAQVIDRTDIAELIAGYVPLKHMGRNQKGLCPFHHEKTPSFVVTADKQIFHCFGCGVGGNVLSFVMKIEHLEFPEAVRFLAQKAGITIPEEGGDSARDSFRQQIFQANEEAVAFFHAQLISLKTDGAKAAQQYLKARGVSLECVKQFRLGYAPDGWDALLNVLRAKGFDNELIEKSGLVVPRQDGKGVYDRFRGRVIFPIFDYRGRSIAFGARAIDKTEKAKYINSSETPVYTKGQHLYGFNWAKDAISKEDAVVIVEGYMDLIRPFFAGVHHVSASLGTALTIDQIRLIRRYTHNVIMLYDMDAAGQAATLRSLDLLLEEDMNVRIATLAAGEDPDSFIQKYGVEDFRQCLTSARGLFDFKLSMLLEQYGSSTPEARANICKEMILTVEKIKSEVAKDGYYRQLAAKLNVPETAIFAERGKVLSKKPPVSSQIVPVEKRKEAKLRSDEALLLAMMLREPKWAMTGRQSLTPESFTHPAACEIAARLFELVDGAEEPAVAAVCARLEDEESRMLAAKLASTPSEQKDEDETRAFNDCIKRVRGAVQKARRDVLRAEIRTAEQAGEQERVLALQQEFNQLIKS